MNSELQKIQHQSGTIFDAQGVPQTFGNDSQAFEAVRSGVALGDRSHWGRIEVKDGDRLRFLHNQTTNDFYRLPPGQGCETIFVTSTARTLDIATAYVLEEAVLLLVSPGQSQSLIQFMDRYIFRADRVCLADRTDTWFTFSLLGPKSTELLESLGMPLSRESKAHQHQDFNLSGVVLRTAVGSGLPIPGYTLMGTAEQAAKLWQILTQAGATPMGDRVWERLRIEQGRPMPGHELTEDYNPLEAGLWHLISFNKGCYIGQETIARLDTYKGVKQQLWGVNLDSVAAFGTPLYLEGEKIGLLTSVIATETGALGLAYVRTKAGGAGLTVEVGETSGILVDVPYLTHERQV
jgi:hypothetical protein